MVELSTLGNGLRVISDPMDTVETVSVGIWVEVGTRHESPDINGVSHLLEHMAFKGTERRSARAIAEEIEAVGGILNAYTSRENTAYFAKVLKEDLELAVDIIADIVQNPVMAPDELARERDVIVQEINQAHDTPDDIVFDHFQKTAFPDQGLGLPVLGSAELVQGMERKAILDYMGGHYNPRRMVLAAAGRVDHQRLVGLAEAAFESAAPGPDISHDSCRYAGGDYREQRDLEQVHLVFGFEGVAFQDHDFYALSVFSTLLGGGMSSRLFQEIRENRGLVYNIYSFVSCYNDGGLFGIYAGTGEDQVEDLIPLVCEEMGKACERVTDEEVARTRAQLKASILMSLESTTSRCEQAARQLMVYGRPIPVSEIVERIEAVDADAVIAAARRLRTSRPTFTALGPLERIETYQRLAERLV